jgi:hypothetical protein
LDSSEETLIDDIESAGVDTIAMKVDLTEDGTVSVASLPSIAKALALIFGALGLLAAPAQAADIPRSANPGGSLAASASPSTGEFRFETLPIAAGAELVTLIRRMPDSAGPNAGFHEVPVLSVVRDTLGDADGRNDRLGEVYTLAGRRPTVRQRIASAIPLFYWRKFTGASAGEKSRRMRPILDLRQADRPAWESATWGALQVLLLDDISTPVRASTRTFRGNQADLRNTQLFRAAGVVTRTADDAEPDTGAVGLSAAEREQLLARLMLATSVTGGWVNSSSLARVAAKKRNAIDGFRGRNWELLRQRAEAEGLWFEPVRYAGSDAFATLWIAHDDLAREPVRSFDGRFLGITDPWTDASLRHWRGVAATWYFGADGTRVSQGTPGATAREMIPLAFYALEHPRVPLLLVDFRNGGAPRRREMARRSTQTVLTGIVGVSQFANWYYFAGHSAWFFITGRRGGAVDRNSRQSAYSLFRTFLWLDDSLDPALRNELRKRERLLTLNPLEGDEDSEARGARRNYDDLVGWLGSPEGRRHLENERREELSTYVHSETKQVLLQMATVASLGLYRHREPPGPELEETLAVERALKDQSALIERHLAATPLLDVTANMSEIRAAVAMLGRYPEESRRWHGGRLIRDVFMRALDRDTRRECLAALGNIDDATGSHELLALSTWPSLEGEWRLACFSQFRATESRKLPIWVATVPGTL